MPSTEDERARGARVTELETARYERRVMAAFVDGERLKSIPARRKKRLVVLRWLGEDFAPGRRYREAEVNELLRRHHEDCAALRRELVDWGLLRRAAGVYWREEDAR